jgi:hypothetical protein
MDVSKTKIHSVFRATAKITTTTTKPNCLPGNFSEKSFDWKGSKKSRKKLSFQIKTQFFDKIIFFQKYFKLLI